MEMDRRLSLKASQWQVFKALLGHAMADNVNLMTTATDSPAFLR